jgi:hypothetical protein
VKIISLLGNILARGYYRWAMREINPTHADVPKIIMRQAKLNEEWRRLWRS